MAPGLNITLVMPPGIGGVAVDKSKDVGADLLLAGEDGAFGVPAEDVAKDRDQEPEPDHEREERDHPPQDIEERVISYEHRVPLLRSTVTGRFLRIWPRGVASASEPPSILRPTCNGAQRPAE